MTPSAGGALAPPDYILPPEPTEAERALAVATSLRARLEAREVDVGFAAELYAASGMLSEGRDPRRAAELALSWFPGCACGAAGALLRHELGGGRLAYGSYADLPHVFVSLAGDLIADVTADQFGGPPVYVGPLRLPWREECP